MVHCPFPNGSHRRGNKRDVQQRRYLSVDIGRPRKWRFRKRHSTIPETLAIRGCGSIPQLNCFARNDRKSVLSLPETRDASARDKHHIYGSPNVPASYASGNRRNPDHLRSAKPPALGRTVNDEFIVPLCRARHCEMHRSSDEVGWWKQAGIDPLGFAQKLRISIRCNNQLPRSPMPCDTRLRNESIFSPTRHFRNFECFRTTAIRTGRKSESALPAWWSAILRQHRQHRLHHLKRLF
jgi:hypothetical protein